MIETILHLSITTDLWTLNNNKSYITIAGHFIWEFKLKSCFLGTKEVIINHAALNIGKAIINILSKFPGSLNKICGRNITSEMKKNRDWSFEKNSIPLRRTHTEPVCSGNDHKMLGSPVLNKCRTLHALNIVTSPATS